MTPFEAFKLHQALKSHFTTDYDFVKYRGKIKASLDKFEKRPDYRRYVLLSKKPHLQDYIIANLVSGNSKWVGDLLSNEAESCYENWRNRNEALTYKFREQLTMLNDDFDSNFVVVDDHTHPKLLRLMIEGLIWPETPVILNQLVSFTKQWDRKLADDFMWMHWGTFVKKYDAFVKFDREKIISLILSKFNK